MNRIIIIFLVFFVTACVDNKTSANKKVAPQIKKTAFIQYKIDVNNKQSKKYVVGDDVEMTYKTNSKFDPDSIKLLYKNNELQTYVENKLIFNTSMFDVGIQKIDFVFYWGDSIKQSVSKNIKLFSDIVPQRYSYKIIQSWPHSIKAYTQGLEFNNGYLYEGTGNYGESMLTKVKIETNEIIQSVNLPSNVFGEGITIVNDKIYQLTWKSSIGYVYDKENLNKLFEFSYPTDGWGLTNNGDELIMSDGSENIYFLDKEYFSELRRIQVYDQSGAVNNLNELELINGELYANIYGTNNIVTIDVETGKVLKTINLKGLLNPNDIKARIDVLNGIAWEPEKEWLVVTGKWWPKIFQIELIAI